MSTTPASVVRHPGEFRWETRLLAMVTATLVVFGLANSYGASSLVGTKSGIVGYGFALRQLSGALAGGLLLMILSRVDYRRLKPLAWPIMIGAIILLLVPVTPGIKLHFSPMLNGARRWIRVGPIQFQPSEIARLAVVIWCAMLAAKKGEQIRDLKKGVMPFLVVLGVVFLLVLGEPNLSMATLIVLLGMLVVFTAGARIGHFILLGIGGLLLVFHKINDAQYRMARLTTFLNPGDATSDAALQVHQSIVGIGSGGVLGVGFGHGQQKLGYLPYAYSDFLFSIIGEEWGFIGVVMTVMLFGLFCWLGFRIARTAEDPFGQYLATGLTMAVGLTAFMHMAVTLGMMPTTGLTLPFMSYGRSSLIVTLAGAGLLISVGRMRGKGTARTKRDEGTKSR